LVIEISGKRCLFCGVYTLHNSASTEAIIEFRAKEKELFELVLITDKILKRYFSTNSGEELIF